MVRQGTALRLLLRIGWWIGNRVRRPRDLFVFDPELELVEGFRAGAEALPAQTRELVLEPLDQKVAVAQLGVTRRQLGPRGHHHRFQRGDVVGQGMRLFEHGPILPERAAKGKLEWSSTHC